MRCFAPRVGEAFWNGAEPVEIGEFRALVPCAADQLLHACSHGLQWSWTPQTRWVSDAMTILTSHAAVDWVRFCELAKAAGMCVRLHAALVYLSDHMQAPIPAQVMGELLSASSTSGAWERREYRLLQKPCPLGEIDSVWWHVTNFRRIRRYDDAWRKKPAVIAFPEYLRAFLRGDGESSLIISLWQALRNRPTADR